VTSRRCNAIRILGFTFQLRLGNLTKIVIKLIFLIKLKNYN